MKRSLKKLLTSKKFIMAVTGIVLEVIVALLPEKTLTPELQSNLMWLIGAIILVAVGGQAVADHGKEAKAIEVASNLPSHVRADALVELGVSVPKPKKPASGGDS